MNRNKIIRGVMLYLHCPIVLSMVHKGETAPGNFGKLASSLALSVLLLAPTAAPAAKEQVLLCALCADAVLFRR